MRKSLTLTLGSVTAGIVAILATPAGAATAPAHLTGHWTVKQTVTKQSNGQSGTSTAAWTFAPTCTTGACAIKMTRAHSDGSKLTYTVKPTTSGTYQGATTYLGSCYSLKTGAVIYKNGYHYSESAVIKPTASKAGTATAFTGTLKLTFTPISSKVGQSCPAGFIDLALKSVKRTS